MGTDTSKEQKETDSRKLQSEHHWQRDRNQSQFPDSGDILTLLSHQHHQPLTACPDSEGAVQNSERRQTPGHAVSYP